MTHLLKSSDKARV